MSRISLIYQLGFHHVAVSLIELSSRLEIHILSSTRRYIRPMPAPVRPVIHS